MKCARTAVGTYQSTCLKHYVMYEENCLLSFSAFGVRTEFVKASFTLILIKIKANLNTNYYIKISVAPPPTSLFAPLESDTI